LSDPLHATLIARRSAGAWRGLLLRGPSGVGKSDLTLRLIGRGWRLVADDRVIAWRSGGRVFGRAPDALRNLVEVRGVGVIPCPALCFAEITAVIDCIPVGEAIERIPVAASVEIAGVALRLLRLHPLESGAPGKVAAFCGAACV